VKRNLGFVGVHALSCCTVSVPLFLQEYVGRRRRFYAYGCGGSNGSICETNIELNFCLNFALRTSKLSINIFHIDVKCEVHLNMCYA
jgi:hypothetical protein